MAPKSTFLATGHWKLRSQYTKFRGGINIIANILNKCLYDLKGSKMAVYTKQASNI